MRLRTLVGNLGLAATSAITFAMLLELGARAIGIDAVFFLLPTPSNCLRRDPLLSMSFRPGCKGNLAGTNFHTNSLGTRGSEPRSDVSRILSTGDSCTWGWRVEEEETYPAVLEQILNRRSDRHPHQVINAGVPGYTSFQGVEYLRDRGMRLDPEIVIISYGFNDVFRVGDVEQQIRTERTLFPLLRVDDFLLNRSALYRYARQQAEAKATNDRAPRVEAETYGDNLRRMVDLARERGAKVMLLSFWGALAPEKEYRWMIAAVAQERAVPFVAYTGPLQDVVHPTAEGYRALAAKIAERLVSEGWIDASS